MAQPTVDDLQSMFPQIPLTAIQDIVEQSGGAERAMEVLLASADTQRASYSPTTVPLVSRQLVNMPAASQPGNKPRPMPSVGTGRVGGQLAPNNSWVPPYLMHADKVARHKSPPKSPRKKERHAGGAVGVLGILTSMHDIKAGRVSPPRAKISVSPQCNGQSFVAQPQPPQQQQQSSAVLLPWQHALSSQAAHPNACVNCSSRSPSPACQQAISKVSSVASFDGQGSIGQPYFGSTTTSPVVAQLVRRISSPDVLATTPASLTPGQHPLQLNYSSNNSNTTTPSGSVAAGSQQSSPSQQQSLFPYLQQPPPPPQQPLFPYLQHQQASNASSPRTPPHGGQPATAAAHQQQGRASPSTGAAAAPDLLQKVQFLRGMFADLDLTDANLEHLLASSGGDVGVAVNKLLEVQNSMDTGGLSEESSSQASADEATPEARLERSMACLRALYPNMDAQEVEAVLTVMEGEVDAAVQVLQDIQRQESAHDAQLAADEALARRLQQQQQQEAQAQTQRPQARQQPPALELPVPRPCPSPVTRSPAPGARSPASGAASPASGTRSPAPAKAISPLPGARSPVPAAVSPAAQQQRGQAGSYTWEQQQEARMVACRITMLRRMFDVRLERDMLEAMLVDAGQDVSIVRDRLLEFGMPLREGREAPRSLDRRGAAVSADGGAAAGATDAELRAMRQSAPGTARAAIHERTQAVYDEERAQARRWMEMKRDFMAEATQYFAKGDYDKANALREEGLRYGQLAYDANQRAKDTIYNRRNNTISNSWDIDLHGLHIEEALGKLSTHVTIFNNLPSYKRIKVITGRGKHSPQEPKLYNAVRDYLMENEYDYEAHLGYFLVHLPPPEEAAAATGHGAATSSLPPTPGRSSPGQAPPVQQRRCRTQDDEELRHVRPQQQLVVPLSAYLRTGN